MLYYLLHKFTITVKLLQLVHEILGGGSLVHSPTHSLPHCAASPLRMSWLCSFTTQPTIGHFTTPFGCCSSGGGWGSCSWGLSEVGTSSANLVDSTCGCLNVFCSHQPIISFNHDQFFNHSLFTTHLSALTPHHLPQ